MKCIWPAILTKLRQDGWPDRHFQGVGAGWGEEWTVAGWSRVSKV